jgi:hypothetical protein
MNLQNFDEVMVAGGIFVGGLTFDKNGEMTGLEPEIIEQISESSRRDPEAFARSIANDGCRPNPDCY